MAALFSRSSRALPVLAGTTIAGAIGVAYISHRAAQQLDSAQNGPSSTTFVAPKTMLFAQSLTVTKSEQVNHDTKRITFSLPGGANQVSGVPAGCKIVLLAPARLCERSRNEELS